MDTHPYIGQMELQVSCTCSVITSFSTRYIIQGGRSYVCSPGRSDSWHVVSRGRKEGNAGRMMNLKLQKNSGKSALTEHKQDPVLVEVHSCNSRSPRRGTFTVEVMAEVAKTVCLFKVCVHRLTAQPRTSKVPKDHSDLV